MDPIAKIYKPMHSFIDMVSKKFSIGLVIYSEGGMGKTYNVVQHLEETGVDYVVISGYTTPLRFFLQLYENRDKIIVLDDIEGLLADERGLAILKAALWSINNTRTVSYDSSTSHLQDIPSNFEFTGRIIFLINHFPKRSMSFNAMLSRCLFYELNLGYDDKIALLMNIAKSPYKDTKQEDRNTVMEFIKTNCSPATEHLNIRTMLHLFDAYRYDPKDFKIIAKELLPVNEELVILEELLAIDIEDKERIKIFRMKTGKSRATWYNLKKELRKRKSKSLIN